MYVIARCKKCDLFGVIDTKDKDIREMERILDNSDFGECPFGGRHVELGKLSNYLEVFWEDCYTNIEKAKERSEELNDEQN